MLSRERGWLPSPGADGKRPGRCGPDSGDCGAQLVSVEFQQVVGGGYEAPFRAGGGPASSFEASDPAVGLDLAEDRSTIPSLRE
jgi:hypothetical protein